MRRAPAFGPGGGGRQGSNKKLVTCQRNDQVNRLRLLGARFLTSEKGATNTEKKKSPVMLDWNWSYWCELMSLNKCKCRCVIGAFTYSLALFTERVL